MCLMLHSECGERNWDLQRREEIMLDSRPYKVGVYLPQQIQSGYKSQIFDH